jgi:hypothetical protein
MMILKMNRAGRINEESWLEPRQDMRLLRRSYGTMGNAVFFRGRQGEKRTSYEAKHSPPTKIGVQNEWN